MHPDISVFCTSAVLCMHFCKLTLFRLQVAVAIGMGQPAFLQVSSDAHPGPPQPPVTL